MVALRQSSKGDCSKLYFIQIQVKLVDGQPLALIPMYNIIPICYK